MSRPLPEVARPGGPRRMWVPALGGAVVLTVLIAIQVPSSEGSARSPEPLDVGPSPPRLAALPELATALPPEREQAGPSSPATSPYADELAYELQRRALREAEVRRKRAAERQRSPIVLYDKGSSPRTRASFREPSDPGGPGLGGPRRLGAGLGSEFLREALGGPGGADRGGLSREEQFAKRAGGESVETVRAERLGNPSTVVPQGTLIEAVLETAIQSDLPGMVRAQVSADVAAFDGTPMIPRGSRLVGRYQSGVVRGQTRVFVIWTRLLRPDGVSIQLSSPGTDALGRAGFGGEVDTHFFEIFGASLVLSLLDGGIGIAAARAQGNDNSTIVTSGGDDLSRAAEIALQDRVSIPPTIRVTSGTPVQVFVAKDLDFGSEGGGTSPRRGGW